MILFRDSSANKGGVTSSSLEVLAGLGLNDKEFLDLMTSPPGEGKFYMHRIFSQYTSTNHRFVLYSTDSFSDFYLNYTRNIQQIISANATAEVCLDSTS